MKKQIINREETFSLIKEQSSTITRDEMDSHSDPYWESTCEHLQITPIYTEEVMVEV